MQGVETDEGSIQAGKQSIWDMASTASVSDCLSNWSNTNYGYTDYTRFGINWPWIVSYDRSWFTWRWGCNRRLWKSPAGCGHWVPPHMFWWHFWFSILCPYLEKSLVDTGLSGIVGLPVGYDEGVVGQPWVLLNTSARKWTPCHWTPVHVMVNHDVKHHKVWDKISYSFPKFGNE